MYNFEQIGFIPRSIIRTLKRFFKQISLKTDLFVIYEFRVSRYIAIASLQCFFFLIICPWIFQFFVKFLFINTFLKYKTISTDIFINLHQQERAFSQMQTFSQKIYFETLLESFEMIQKNQSLGRKVLKQSWAFQGPMYKCVCSSREVIRSLDSRRELLALVGTLPREEARLPRKKLTEPNFHLPRHSNCSASLINPKAPSRQRLLKYDVFDAFGRSEGHSALCQRPLSPLSDPRRKVEETRLADGSRITKIVKNQRPKLPTSPWKASSLAVRLETGDNFLSPSSRGPARFASSPQLKKGDWVDGDQELLSLSSPPSEDLGVLQSPRMAQRSIAQVYQSYFLKCANFYNKQSVTIITNWILDLVTLLFFLVLLILSTPQILILKTFCIESLLSLSETTKCFFLIFFLDLLVGFHSSKSWEIFLQFFIEHFGFQIHQNFIAFFISTFPVLLDTIFKYWIFRYLNKISPSTVATYQAMIE